MSVSETKRLDREPSLNVTLIIVALALAAGALAIATTAARVAWSLFHG